MYSCTRQMRRNMLNGSSTTPVHIDRARAGPSGSASEEPGDVAKFVLRALSDPTI